MTGPAHPGDEGVSFPERGDGRRSTTGTGRAVFADAARAVDPALAQRIEHTSDWRGGYIRPLRDLVVSAATTPDGSLRVSLAGLESAHRRFVFLRDSGRTSVLEALELHRDPRLGSVTVRGLAAHDSDLSVPYRGRRLFGDDLRRQVDQWVSAGIAEPGLRDAVTRVLDNPDWLDLSDVDIAIMGAGAEMAPTRSLLRWGARVHAVDLPGPDLWNRLIANTRSTAGSLRVPIGPSEHGTPPIVIGGLVHPDDDATVAGRAGADLIGQAPEVRTWLSEIDGAFVLGTYAYADGSTHVLLSMAADAIAVNLIGGGRHLTLAFLATPTDVFTVPFAAVEESRRRWESRGISGLLQSPLRLLRQFQPNYPDDYTSAEGERFGINDSLVPQQGPNYALAKRLQRWRAVAARADGIPVSLNLAPATRTASVVRNRALAAAYAGAGRFGVEVFEPATSSALMAALLVHDLRSGSTGAPPGGPLDLPAATHGGLWRVAYAPRSVLGFAAVLGMFESRT